MVDDDPGHGVAFIAYGWEDKFMNLNNLVVMPAGVTLVNATGVNELNQVAAEGSDGRVYLLIPLAQ